MPKIALIPEIIIAYWKKVTAKKSFRRGICEHHKCKHTVFDEALSEIFVQELKGDKYQLMLTLQMLSSEEVFNIQFLPAFLNNRNDKVNEMKNKIGVLLSKYYLDEVFTEITVNGPITLRKILNNKWHLVAPIAAQALNQLYKQGKIGYQQNSREPPKYVILNGEHHTPQTKYFKI